MRVITSENLFEFQFAFECLFDSLINWFNHKMKTLHILKGGLILSSFKVYFLILFTSSFLLISVQFI